MSRSVGSEFSYRIALVALTNSGSFCPALQGKPDNHERHHHSQRLGNLFRRQLKRHLRAGTQVFCQTVTILRASACEHVDRKRGTHWMENTRLGSSEIESIRRLECEGFAEMTCQFFGTSQLTAHRRLNIFLARPSNTWNHKSSSSFEVLNSLSKSTN